VGPDSEETNHQTKKTCESAKEKKKKQTSPQNLARKKKAKLAVNTWNPGLTRECPDPFGLQYVGSEQDVAPRDIKPFHSLNMCQGSSRFQLKDIMYVDVPDDKDDESDDDDDGDKEDSDTEKEDDDVFAEEMFRLLGGNDDNDEVTFTDEQLEEADRVNEGLSVHVDADAKQDVTNKKNIRVGKRKAASKMAKASTVAIKRHERDNAFYEVANQFKEWRTKKFGPIIMDRRGIRTLNEDAVAKEKAEVQRARRGRSTKKSTSYNETKTTKKLTLSMSKHGNTIVFRMANGEEPVFRLTYEIANYSDQVDPDRCFSAIFSKKCNEAKNMFNEKLDHGIQVVFANAQEFGEGVSFKGVREIVMLNPALRWSEHKQWIGRALRSCDQEGKPVTITTFVAKTGTAKARWKTADEYAWERLKDTGTKLEQALNTKIKMQSIEWDPIEKELVY